MNLTTKGLTSGDVCALSGISMTELSRLVRNGVVNPQHNGNAGEHKLYSIWDAVAVAYGSGQRKHGVTRVWADEVIRYVALLSPEFAEAFFEEGRVVAIPIPPGVADASATLIPPLATTPEAFNLDVVMRRVVEKVKEAGGKLVPYRGRNRTLFEAKEVKAEG